MGTTVNEGAWGWTRLKDDSLVVESNARAHLLQTPWMAHMVPLQHSTEVLMAGVAGWGLDRGSWGPSSMARAYHEALGVSLQSAYPHHELDARLYGLTLIWGTKNTCFHLPSVAAAVSFAISDLVSKELVRHGGQIYAGTEAGMRYTPESLQTEKCVSIAVDEEAKGEHIQVGGTAGVGAREEDKGRPEMAHTEPRYKNAVWVHKTPGAPRWTRHHMECIASVRRILLMHYVVAFGVDIKRALAVAVAGRHKSSRRGKGPGGSIDSDASSSCSSSSSNSYFGWSSSASSSSPGKSCQRKKEPVGS